MNPVTAQRHDDVTKAIVAQLAAGTAPWVRPWSDRPNDLPINIAGKNCYNGTNVLTLWNEQMAFSYPTPEWIGYKQAKALGGQVRTGEKGHVIFFYSKVDKDKAGNKLARPFFFMKSHSIFNVAQVDGLPASEVIEPVTHEERFDKAIEFIDDLGTQITYGGAAARYDEATDKIILPPKRLFKTLEAFVSWNLHEHIKWTGHHNRLGRIHDEKYAGNAAAFEELVCELGAAFLCSELGLPGQLNHAEYLAPWVQILGGDTKAIWSAGSYATKAVTYLKQMAGTLPMPGTVDLNAHEELEVA